MKKIIYSFYTTIISVMLFMVSLNNNWIAAMILFFVTMAVCLVWSAKVLQAQNEAWYKRQRFCSRKFTEIEKKFQWLEKELADKADKPENPQPDSNVRAGSHPSEQYYAMIGKKGVERNDNRSEDTTAS